MAAPSTSSIGTAGGVPPLRSWLGWWLLLVFFWGSSFLLIKVGLESFSPLQISFGRCAFGAVTVVALMLLGGHRLPRNRMVWVHTFVVAIVMNTIPFTLFGMAEQGITSTLAGIFNATTPLFTAVFALLLIPNEKIDRNRVLGLVIGFFGVLVVLGVFSAGQAAVAGDLPESLACIAATACYGIGIPYTRRFLGSTGENPTSIVAAQLLWSSLQLGLLALILSPAPHDLTPQTWAALAALGIFSTGIAFVLNFRIIRDVGSLASAAITYATPIVSTIEGVLLLGEPMRASQPIGALIVLLGVALVQGLYRPLRT